MLNKAIAHGKEWRKPYAGAKAVDPLCRNHGGCVWCTRARRYNTRRRKSAIESQIEDYFTNRYYV